MLAPGLATMLVVITTDAVLDPRRARRRSARRHPRHLRPPRLRRLHVDQRPGDAAGERGIRGHARRVDDFTAVLTEVCARPRRRSCRAMPRARATTSASRSSDAATEDDAVEVGRSVARNNLFKAAVVRQRPELGPRARRDRHDGCRVRPLRRRRDDERGAACATPGGPDRPRDEVDLTPARDARAHRPERRGTPTATILTNDLTHDYVHENCAYSS